MATSATQRTNLCNNKDNKVQVKLGWMHHINKDFLLIFNMLMIFRRTLNRFLMSIYLEYKALYLASKKNIKNN